MIAWITSNAGTVTVSAVLVVAVAAVVFKMVKDKKNGVSSCGGSCAGCGMHGSCDRAENVRGVRNDKNAKD